MDFRIIEGDDIVRVSLTGRLDFACNPVFERLLDEIAPLRNRQIIFDLSMVMHVDSIGLGLLHVAREDLASANSTLTLASPGPSVARMLHLTDAAACFDIQS